MGFEVEIKFRDADHAAIERRLLALGAVPGDPVEQADVYLAHPSRDFAATGEHFRLRRDRSSNRLTYKGPRHAGPTKTRTKEVEVDFEDGPDAWAKMARLVEALGFRPVATVTKTRRPFHLVRDGRPIEVVLDSALGLGDFAEVEALADDHGLGRRPSASSSTWPASWASSP